MLKRIIQGIKMLCVVAGAVYTTLCVIIQTNEVLIWLSEML